MQIVNNFCLAKIAMIYRVFAKRLEGICIVACVAVVFSTSIGFGVHRENLQNYPRSSVISRMKMGFRTHPRLPPSQATEDRSLLRYASEDKLATPSLSLRLCSG